MNEDIAVKIVLIFVTMIATIFGGLSLWGLKALITGIFKNTQELALLNSKIEGIVFKTDKIAKLEEDLKVLHTFRKEIETKKSTKELL